MYIRDIDCTEGHRTEIMFRNYAAFAEVENELLCPCCKKAGHEVRATAAWPTVNTVSSRSVGNYEWTGKDFAETRQAIEAGAEAARPIMGIVNRQQHEALRVSGIDAGTVVAHKDMSGKLHVNNALVQHLTS